MSTCFLIKSIDCVTCVVVDYCDAPQCTLLPTTMPTLVSRLFSRQELTTQSDLVATNTKPTDTASFSDESEESDSNPPTFPLVTNLYDEATEFEKILFLSGCVAPNTSCPMGSTGFANLLGHDLTNRERAIFNRDAKLCAATRQWPPPLKDDPQVLPFDTDDEKTPFSQSPYLSDIEFPYIHRASSHDIEHLDELKPEDIVDILVREFGRLAPKGEEEKLLLETDGCLLHDVAIVVRQNLFYPPILLKSLILGCDPPNHPSPHFSCIITRNKARPRLNTGRNKVRPRGFSSKGLAEQTSSVARTFT